MPGDIIILRKCTKNNDHMPYCSWHMAPDSCNCYFSFWAIFCLLTPITARKMKISKKWKKMPRDIIILHKCTKNHDHKLYCSWDMVCDTCNCYFSFCAIFCPFTAQKSKFQNFKKKKKNYLEISLFYTCIPQIMIRSCTVPKIWCVIDGRTDRCKKWQIEVGAQPKN